MANIKSAQKRVSIARTNNTRNKAVKSGVKHVTKKFEKALNDGNIDAAKDLYSDVAKKLDMASSKGTIHRNAANRKKSQYALKLNKIN